MSKDMCVDACGLVDTMDAADLNVEGEAAPQSHIWGLNWQQAATQSVPSPSDCQLGQ